MNKIGKQKAWNARVWCKEKELLCLKKEVFPDFLFFEEASAFDLI